MIDQNLHHNPVALDSARHRTLRLAMPVTDWSVAARLNAIFVAAAEFADVCRDFPIVFVRVGKEPDGKDQIAPIAVLGLLQGQNLFLDGGTWRARYIPAVLRSYPFCIGRIDDARFAICVDMGWPGVQADGQGGGAAGFEGDGRPAPLLAEAQKQLEALEGEIQRTRLVGARLLELGVLRDMQFDATLPDGSTQHVDGFLTVDEQKMQDLPDAVVAELHRSGLLGLVQLHWVSLGNLRRLVDWHVERGRAAVAAQPATPADAGATKH